MGNDLEDVRVDQSLNDSEPTCQTQGVNARDPVKSKKYCTLPCMGTPHRSSVPVLSSHTRTGSRITLFFLYGLRPLYQQQNINTNSTSSSTNTSNSNTVTNNNIN